MPVDDPKDDRMEYLKLVYVLVLKGVIEGTKRYSVPSKSNDAKLSINVVKKKVTINGAYSCKEYHL